MCLFALFLSPVFFAKAQQATVQFNLNFGTEFLELGKEYLTENNGTVKVETFKVYVSKFSFYSQGKEVHAANNAWLLDAAQPESLTRELALPNGLVYDEVHFYFGIDEATNNSGVGEGDLDPANGMYWAWQSGYINMKLEGSGGTDTKEFQYHLGGFMAPYVSCRTVALSVKNADNLTIGINLKTFFDKTDIVITSAIMSPGIRGVESSGDAALMFFIP